MITIYRYPLREVVNDVVLPANAEVLSVGLSQESKNDKQEISVYAKVDTNNSVTEHHKFVVFGTGGDMEQTETYTLKFIGTVQKSNLYAFHIFEVL